MILRRLGQWKKLSFSVEESSLRVVVKLWVCGNDILGGVELHFLHLFM